VRTRERRAKARLQTPQREVYSEAYTMWVWRMINCRSEKEEEETRILINLFCVPVSNDSFHFQWLRHPTPGCTPKFSEFIDISRISLYYGLSKASFDLDGFVYAVLRGAARHTCAPRCKMSAARRRYRIEYDVAALKIMVP